MATAEHSSSETRAPLVLIAALAAALAALVLLNAWLCDDAFITLRSVKNLVEGRGPVFNAPWRVQSFTHPAWMLLLAGAWALTREAFFTTLALSVMTSVAAIVLALRCSVNAAAAWVCALALASSRAFLEYSSSGLENPLTHLILAAGACLCLQLEPAGGPPREALRRLRAAGLLTSAAFCSRPDAVLLLAPLFIASDRAARASGVPLAPRLRAWLVGAAPALAWELFSLVYYGALVPNTALAKLGLGIPREQLTQRGLAYLWHTASSDPPTALVIAFGLALPLLPARLLAPVVDKDDGAGPRALAPLALAPLARGALAYLTYVVAIGGDFMEGRFLGAPLLCGALALARLRWSKLPALACVVALALLAGLGTRHPWIPDAGEAEPRARAGISDERSHYAASASLLAYRPGRAMPDHRWRALGVAGPPPAPATQRRVAQFSTMGFYGFFADPEVHVVDGFALADPLLAHLPPLRRINWKAGHLPRALPAGYLETLRGDPWDVRILDPEVAELYGLVARVHLGPLLAAGRGAAIFELLSGRATATLERQGFHLAELVRVDLRQLQRRREPLRFRDAGVELVLSGASTELELRLSPGQRYAISYRAGDRALTRDELELELELPGPPDGPLAPVSLTLPTPQPERVHVLPLTMHGRRSLEISAPRRAR